jgi:hypothetical protein
MCILCQSATRTPQHCDVHVYPHPPPSRLIRKERSHSKHVALNPKS